MSSFSMRGIEVEVGVGCDEDGVTRNSRSAKARWWVIRVWRRV